MTPLAARFRSRVLAKHDTSRPLPAGVVRLSQVAPHQSVRISGYAEDLPPSHCRRLFDLGFAPGAQVTVVRRAPALDPCVYRVAGTEVALRRTLSASILVRGS